MSSNWSPFPARVLGLEGLKGVLRAKASCFPRSDFLCSGTDCQGDKVASRFEWTGTRQGTFLGVPATGRFVRVWEIVIDRLEKGRIKDTRIVMDTLGLMIQLGALAPPGA
jgi:predicted ester cyclase